MKMIIAFAALVAVALAAPQQVVPQQRYTEGASGAVIVKESPSDNIGTGGYSYSYELSNGQTHQETAQAKTVGNDVVLVVTGTYTYVDPKTNQQYRVTYTADEDGFHPVGDHIPA